MFKRIYIELSNYCNLNCVFCTPKNKSNRMLTFDQYKYILDQVKSHTKEVCLHVLGEPTIHPNFIDICKYTNNLNLDIMLSSNGRKIPSIKEKLLSTNIKTFNLSLHSTYMLSDEKRDEYLKQLLEFIDLYQEKYVSVFHLRLWADSNKEIKENNDKIKNYLFNHYDYSGPNLPRIKMRDRVILSYEKEFEWPTLLNNHNSHGFCLGGKTHIAILANGNVVICCLDTNGDTCLGNIFENSLDEILSNDKYQTAIKSFRENKCSLELCRHCTYKNGVK